MHSSATNSYLTYVKQSRPTGRQIAKILDIPFGLKKPPRPIDVLIRWGSRKPMPTAKLVLNRPEAIAMASDKVRAFKAMEQEGIRTIPYATSIQDALNKGWKGATVMGRKRHGMGGKDIHVFRYFGCDENGQGMRLPFPQEYNGFDFFSWYIRPTREYRLHVVGDRVVRIQGKYADFPEQQRSSYIRNYANGYRFRAPKHDLRTDRKQQAIRAVKACGLDFGAVDMLMDSSGHTYVLEVNTAPACSPLTARCYAGALALMVEGKSGVVLAEELLHMEMPGITETEDE